MMDRKKPEYLLPSRVRVLFRSPVTWIILLTAAYFIVLAVRPAESWFGVPGQWTWSGRPPAPSTIRRWPLAIVVLAVMLLSGLALDQKWHSLRNRYRLLALAGLVLFIPISQIALKYIHYRYPMEYYLFGTIGPHNGFWQASVAIESVGEYLRTYPTQMRSMKGVFVHLPVHPPGNIMYLWSWRKLFEVLPAVGQAVAHFFRGFNCADFAFVTLEDAQIANAFGPMFILLTSSLTILPLYWWTSSVAGRRVAWRACVFYGLVPALSLFTMRWDARYTLFVALAFALLHHGIVTGRAAYWFASGLVISYASFSSFGNATFAPALAIYAALHLLRRKGGDLLETWPQWLALIAGGYSLWGIYHLATGITVWEIFNTALETHLHLGRDYWPWVFYNLYDLVAFIGIPLSLLSVRALFSRDRLHLDVHFPLFAALSVILALNFSGVVRGEVGRMWLPWAPVFCLSAAVASYQHGRRGLFSLSAALLALQALWMSLFLRISPTGMHSYIPRRLNSETQSELMASSSHTRLTDVVFEEGIALVGYEVPEEARVGEDVTISLIWLAENRPNLPYTVFVHVVDKRGGIVAQDDGMPVDDELPTSCWLDGELVEDVRRLQLSPDISPGNYTIYVGLYYLPTMQRLELMSGLDDKVSIPLRVVRDGA